MSQNKINNIPLYFNNRLSVEVHIYSLSTESDIALVLFDGRFRPSTVRDLIPVTKALDVVIVGIPSRKIGKVRASRATSHDRFPHIT